MILYARNLMFFLSMLCGLYSVGAFFGGLGDDAGVSAVVGILAAGLAIWLTEAEDKRQARLKAEREWMRDYRGAWFASFERRQRVIAAREAGR